MLPITLLASLPFISAKLRINEAAILDLRHVLIDTGSAATLLKTDDLQEIGIRYEGTDTIRQMFGIGDGEEFVIEKRLASLQIGDLIASSFTIQMGALAYDFPIDGIIGADFLIATGAILDFKQMNLRQGE